MALRQVLRAKIHDARVTNTTVDYVGSITIDRALIDAAGLCVYEKVLVANITNSKRFETYVIEGGPGQIELNGAAANLAEVGDRVIIMAFGLYSEQELGSHEPTIVLVDEANKVCG